MTTTVIDTSRDALRGMERGRSMSELLNELNPPTPAKMPRIALLEEALSITSKDRNTAYGNPEDNFKNIADYWNMYAVQSKLATRQFSAQDVAHMMILMKMARLNTNFGHRDSLVDIAGYAACAADCQVQGA